MKFSAWTEFDLRDKAEKRPGIYAIAISKKDISDTPFDYVEEVAYIGMTNSKGGLSGRLNAFNNTLRDKSGPGHGGAERFRHDFEDGEALAKKLYVAVCPFKCDDGYVATAPVGSFKPNGFGLYDIIGNVDEMVEDHY